MTRLEDFDYSDEVRKLRLLLDGFLLRTECHCWLTQQCLAKLGKPP